MGSVGLLYVGAVLVINGLALLGRVGSRDAVPLNLFVGALQVFTPTYLVVTADGDPDTVLAAAGLYLFGFTYLYVALGTLLHLEGTGLGWFSLFVAACALVYAVLNATRFDDLAFAVIWLMWAYLWLLFFLVLALGHAGLTRYTGGIAVVEGVVTGAVPALLLLTGEWAGRTDLLAAVLAVVAVVAAVGLYPLLRPRPSHGHAAPPTDPRTSAPEEYRHA